MTSFTLAEVLIVLGIIGLIADMTIPTLINSYEKQVTVTRLQKFYSTFQQALKLAEVDNGNLTDWDWTLSSENFKNTYFAPYLKTLSTCNGVNGCWNKINSIKCIGSNTLCENFNDTTYSKFSLADGTYVTFTNQTTTNHMHVYADLNGEKEPNMYGKDCFIFTLTPKPLYETNLHDIKSSGFYLYGQGMDENLIKTYCKKGSGQGCGLKIQRDGWKITEDYPW